MAQTQFTAKIELSRALEKQMEASMVGFTTSAVEALAAHFKFDSKEAIKLLGLEKVEVARKTVKPKSEKAPKAKKEQATQEHAHTHTRKRTYTDTPRGRHAPNSS